MDTVHPPMRSASHSPRGASQFEELARLSTTESPVCLVNYLRRLMLPPPVVHVVLDAVVSATSAVSMLYSKLNRFQLQSSCVAGVPPHGEAASSPEQNDGKLLKMCKKDLSTAAVTRLTACC